MVLDGETLLLAPRGAELIAASDGAALPGNAEERAFASALELNTNICATVDEAAQALVELRRAATALAEERGLRLAAAGSHPISRPEDQEIADEPRYEEFVDYAGVSARFKGSAGSTCTSAWRAPTLASMRSRASCRGFPSCSPFP